MAHSFCYLILPSVRLLPLRQPSIVVYSFPTPFHNDPSRPSVPASAVYLIRCRFSPPSSSSPVYDCLAFFIVYPPLVAQPCLCLWPCLLCVVVSGIPFSVACKSRSFCPACRPACRLSGVTSLSSIRCSSTGGVVVVCPLFYNCASLTASDCV